MPYRSFVHLLMACCSTAGTAVQAQESVREGNARAHPLRQTGHARPASFPDRGGLPEQRAASTDLRASRPLAQAMPTERKHHDILRASRLAWAAWISDSNTLMAPALPLARQAL